MQDLTVEEYFALAERSVIIDVRSPTEYDAGHVEGAASHPLFNDAERAEVGTLYKQLSPDAALLRGLEFAGARMRELVEGARRSAPSGEVVVQCWRGGQRSASVGWLLEQAGMNVRRLTGGYRAYRTYARAYLGDNHHQLKVLSGPTGSGKTPVLHALRTLGADVVDLEGLAHHKGSSFGALGEASQPSTEQFENRLFASLVAIPAGRTVWIEDESRLIGTVCQPSVFYDRLLAAPAVALVQPIDWRVDNLVRDYARYPKEGLKAAFTRLRKKLGGQHLNTALEALERDDFTTACRIALTYYDKAYAHYASRKTSPVTELTVHDPAAECVARQLLQLP